MATISTNLDYDPYYDDVPDEDGYLPIPGVRDLVREHLIYNGTTCLGCGAPWGSPHSSDCKFRSAS